jgi:hypothetical protein
MLYPEPGTEGEATFCCIPVNPDFIDRPGTPTEVSLF